MSESQWQLIRPKVSRENYNNILIVTLAVMAMMAVMLVASLFSEKAQSNRILYVIMFACCLATYLITKCSSPDKMKRVTFLTYLMISICLLYASTLGTVFSPNQLATAFPAFILASPLLFMGRRRDVVVCILFHTAVFVCMVLIFDDAQFVVDDIVNSCVFTAVSIIINSYMIRVRMQMMLSELRLAEHSEKDLLTGVKNRNSYELAIFDYPHRCERSLGCLFLDSNGLHELNDAEGHAAGDAMLKCVSSALKEEFGEDDTYRIGGDEFVVFVADPDEGELDAKAKAVRNAVEQCSYHVSIGAAQAHKPLIDMTELVKRAEVRMYDDKRRYYEQEGIDRRKNRDARDLEPDGPESGLDS